jgi:hypothetical protein
MDTNRRLRVFEMSCLRRIAGVIRHDRNRNDVSRTNVKINRDIVEKVTMKRLGYFDHVARMNHSRLPYIVMHGRVNGSRGRPQKRWMDTVKMDCKKRGLTVAEMLRAA